MSKPTDLVQGTLDLLLLPLVPAGVSLTLWLLVRGVDAPKWEEKAAAAA